MRPDPLFFIQFLLREKTKFLHQPKLLAEKAPNLRISLAARLHVRQRSVKSL
jgi:hypothetical protein